MDLSGRLGLALIGICRIGGALILLAGSACLLRAEPGGGSGARTPAYTKAALERLLQQDYAGAARQTRLAMQSNPDDGTLYALAGALLMRTGQYVQAEDAFGNALKSDASDDLALYGLALSRLAQGDRQSAEESLDRSERAGGNPSCLIVARRYVQWLDGAQIAPEGVGLPDEFVSALDALKGMSALRRGDGGTAEAGLLSALRALPGDGVRETFGLLMTFDAARPLATENRGTVGIDIPVAPYRKSGLRGVMSCSPEEPGSDVAYVGYELDGQSLALVNVRPFDYSWDSRQATNGRHRLTIVLYDAKGLEISRNSRQVLVSNPASSGDLASIRAELWRALTLRPERYACCMGVAHIHMAQSDVAGARPWLERAAAAKPDDSVRHELAASGGLTSTAEALWGGRSDEKLVALTFDDGPKPGLTDLLLDMLEQERVPATFFVIGRHVLEYPELTRRIVRAGMEIANHSFSHRNLTRITPEEVAQETMQTQVAVFEVAGVHPRFLRPPGGDWNGQVASVVRAWGLTPCMWTVDAYASEVIGPQQAADAVLQQVQPGSIILMHNGKLSTLQALPTIIRELRARGYSFATVSALAHRLDMAREETRQAAHSQGRLPSRSE